MPFGLYLHFPFCRNRCSYCDFYKEIHRADRELEFWKALSFETELVAETLESHERLDSIFVGGGTPSLANLASFRAWIEQLHSHIRFSDTLEFSIETNPESVDRDLLTAFRDLGINRPLFGIQSFQTDLLELLDRRHNPYHSQRAIYLANALDFRNYGVDIIFGLPGQSHKQLEADLNQVVDLAPPHISYYQLTVETGTPLAQRVVSGDVRMLPGEDVHSMYRAGCEKFRELGYQRYEVSSFARPGFQCRHNLGYWEGGDYIGLGPSAHSFLDGRRFANEASLAVYVKTLTEQRRQPLVHDLSDDSDRMTEAVMLGLRTSRGISRSEFAGRFGSPLEDVIDDAQFRLLVSSGHVIADPGSVRLSDEGLDLADEITRRLLK